jgi:phosphomannomutase
LLGIFAKAIEEGRTVGQLLDFYLERYPILQQEQNYTTSRAKEIIDGLAANHSEGIQDWGDGVSVEFPTWRVNLRMSANEPVMRMNLEARSQEELEQRHQELHSYITAEGAVLRDDNH